MEIENNMQIYIIGEGETFELPVNPFSISEDGGKKYETFDILYRGEVDYPSKKAKRIKTLNMSILLPIEYEPFCNYEDIIDPSEVIEKLEKFSDSEEPVRMIITGYNFNELGHLSEYPSNADPSDLGGRRVDLSFRIVNEQEEPEEAKVVQKIISPSPDLKPRLVEAVNTSETVKSGDSLWKIAKKVYGDGSQYKKIYEANKSTIGSNPNLIKPGQKLIIPK